MKTWYVLLILGIIILLLFLLVAIIGMAYLGGIGPEEYSQEEKHDSGVMILTVCSPVLLIPGIIFFAIGWRGRSHYNKLKDVADVLKAYRKIELSKLAQKLGRNEIETEKLVMKCVENKLIYGYIDRQAGAFFTGDYLSQVQDATHGWKCPSCGAYNDKVLLPGETAKCNYCGKLLPSHLQPGISKPETPPLPPITPPPPPPPQPPVQQAYGSSPPPPPPPPPAPAGQAAGASTTCPQCRSPLVFVSQYNKWFCDRCEIYV